ncbi:porin [Aquabacterium sp.]|uniref:porin n=1 Tax=Aquabacterium sp. TaxID=1872578 RepID=UPI0035AFAC60
MFAKKSLVAVAALLSVMGAQAQSSLNIYGNLDVAFGSFESAFGDRVTRVESGIEAGSFIGFKGQEDLGGGLKAIFKLESVIGMDTGATTTNMWTRTSEVGLTGGFGTVTAGNSLSLNFLANATYNPFPVTGALNVSENLFGHSVGVGSYRVAVDEAFRSNAVTYTSPNLGGFTVAAQYGAAESTTGTDDTYALQANYAVGKLSVGGTYTDFDSKKAWQVGASYDFGVAKAFGQYAQAKYDGAPVTYKVYQLGVAVPVTANSAVLASYGEGKYDSIRLRQFSAAYDYSLSKRTGVYAGALYDHAKAGSSDSGTTYAVGLRHAF